MITLASKLGATAHVSPLLRKARRLGVGTLDQAMALAVARGCGHYRNVPVAPAPDVSSENLADEELVILLLLGEQRYEPFAVRIAAQLMASERLDSAKLVFLATRERCERVLGRIALAGREHDRKNRPLWTEILEEFEDAVRAEEPDLPHWSRYVSDPGIIRGTRAETVWLAPDRNES